MRSLPRLAYTPIRAGLLGVAVAAGITGLAVAASSGTGDVINACASKKTGELRLIDRSKRGTAGTCRTSERGVVWSVAGPAGEAGVAGAQGPNGAVGPQGVAGANGVNGSDGAPGPEGPKGEPGLPGTTIGTSVRGPNGPPGPTGPVGARGVPGPTGPQGAAAYSGGEIPVGVTMRGVVSARDTVTQSATPLEASISFPFLVPETLEAHFVGLGATAPAACTGSSANPTAARGHLCVYSNAERNLGAGNASPGFIDSATTFVTTVTRPFGITVRAFSASPGDAYFYATWAATR